MTRFFIDTEFVDDGKTIELISIGIVSHDGREYYAQSAEFLQYGTPTPWLLEHVIPHLDNEWTERATIRDEVKAFMDPEKYGKPEIWAWCGSYDHIALCQLFGTMMDIPAGWPYSIHDIQNVLDDREISDDQLPRQEGNAHNALEDAQHIKKLWGYIARNDCWQ